MSSTKKLYQLPTKSKPASRYLYSCVFKNVGILNEEFFQTFLFSANLLLVGVAAFFMVGTGAAAIFNPFCFCSHISFDHCDEASTTWAVVPGLGLTFVLHCVMFGAIKVNL